jgi:hypothetical protein
VFPPSLSWPTATVELTDDAKEPRLVPFIIAVVCPVELEYANDTLYQVLVCAELVKPNIVQVVEKLVVGLIKTFKYNFPDELIPILPDPQDRITLLTPDANDLIYMENWMSQLTLGNIETDVDSILYNKDILLWVNPIKFDVEPLNHKDPSVPALLKYTKGTVPYVIYPFSTNSFIS